MADARKVGILVLFLLYVLSSSANVEAKVCPFYCLDVVYMTCKASSDEKLKAECNCCLAPKDCTLHLSDGSSVDCN
ncbi:uncharacterized protein LOC111277662 isoform X2 [Durio zibethinus]|uniref:Uncharacterized protein LOC111277662 isoform X2 n=1 Tax=Durio zibethinus TaxID=66656 RepID=A0A6P5WVF0_DURZI|nr:uncharacterized protein LOC111277662 isoform X2 [Durio zibethinus]